MNEITSYQSTQLPDTLEDLTQFVLVGKAKLDAYMLKLRTINKLSVAQGIRDQTLKEAQEVSTALIAAEQRIGELLLAIPKQTGNQYTSATSQDGEKAKSKTEIASDMGYSRKNVDEYQQMAKNPEIVAKIINEAIENGEVATKTQVMREIAEAKRQAKAEAEEENKRLRSALSESETRRIQAEQNVKEVVKEIEIIPDDYVEYKKKAKLASSYENDYKREHEKVNEEKRKNLELQNEIDELKLQTAQATTSAKLIEGSIYFVAQCGSFVRDMGGYIWIADKIAELPDGERVNFIKAVKAIHDWAEILQQNIERNI